MIVKKTRNKKTGSTKAARVAGVANYIVAPHRENGLEKCIHHEAENFITDTHEGHVAEMIALAQDAVRSKDPIDHWVLSWPPTERPTVDQVREAVQIFIGHCGLTGHQVIWGLHDDTKNLHVHIAVNRVHPDTLKVIEINKGFQLNAAHQAIAIIEKKQGWKSVESARYKTNEKGELLTDSKTNRPAVNKAKDKPLEPTGPAQDMEIQTGQKSAQRIGIENAPQIISTATSWTDLHTKMQAAGMEYRREGSGAKIYVGDVAVKASDVDRKASFGNLQKRFGLYQPTKEKEIKNDPHSRTQLITDDRFSTSFDEPNVVATGFSTFNTLRDLPRSNLDVTNTTNRQKSKTQNLLQSHEGSYNRGAGGMRRGSNSDRPEIGARGEIVPLKENQPGWHEYIVIRDTQKAAKTHDTFDLQNRQGDERAALSTKQKAERSEIFSGNWKGKGIAKNALQSIIATLQAAEKLELSEQQRDERKALQARYKPLPIYKQWKEQPQIVGLVVLSATEQDETRDKQITLAKTLRSLTSSVDSRHHITYQLNNKDVFRDEGRTIQVLDLNSEAGIAAALATAQQKYGNVLTLTGSLDFRHNAVAVAVANNLTCKFADPELDALRARMQADKYQVERATARAAAERLQATEKAAADAKANALEAVPSNPTREAVLHVPAPEAQQQPGTQAVDHLADIHKKIEAEKAAAKPAPMVMPRAVEQPNAPERHQQAEQVQAKAITPTPQEKPLQHPEIDSITFHTEEDKELAEHTKALYVSTTPPGEAQRQKLGIDIQTAIREAVATSRATEPKTNVGNIESDIKAEHNREAARAGQMEPWPQGQSNCGLFVPAANARRALEAHSHSQFGRPLMFGRKEYDDRTEALTRQHKAIEDAAEAAVARLSREVAQRVAAARQKDAQNAAGYAHSEQRVDSLKALEKIATRERSVVRVREMQNQPKTRSHADRIKAAARQAEKDKGKGGRGG